MINVKNSFICKPVGFIIMLVGIVLMIISQKLNFDKQLTEVNEMALQDIGHEKSVYVFISLAVFVIGWILFAFGLARKEKKDISIT